MNIVFSYFVGVASGLFLSAIILFVIEVRKN